MATTTSTDYRDAKFAYRQRRTSLQLLKDAALLTIGILSAGFGLKSFLLANDLLDGGATGISILITRVTGIPLSYIIVIVNFPFLYLGFKQLGYQFMIKMMLGIIGLALCLAFIQYPTLTKDKLLVAVFGGFFLGAGIGFAIRAGGVLDGTEVVAIFLSRKLSISIGDVIMVINILIFGSAVYLLGIEPALYSMLTKYIPAKGSGYFHYHSGDGFAKSSVSLAGTILPEEYFAIQDPLALARKDSRWLLQVAHLVDTQTT